MQKKAAAVLALLFLLCLVLPGAASLAAPDRTFSEQENRVLASIPAFTGNALLSGRYTADLETYLSDQFIQRDAWLAVQAWSVRLLGRHENGGIFFGSRDTLLPRLADPDPAQVEANAGYAEKLRAEADVPVLFALIPTAAEIWADRLPANADTADQSALIDAMCAVFQGPTADVLGALAAHRDEEIFYRTDHHWTTLGAYYGYCAVLEAMGISPQPLSAFTPVTVADDFFGTSCSASGAVWTAPDRIETFVPEPAGLTVTEISGGESTAGRLYHPNKLAERDKYAFFLGGVQPVIVLETGRPEGERLLILRDSFADALTPFLPEHFAEIHLLDPRYYHAGSVQDYIRENAIDRVLILYSVPNFVAERSLGAVIR